MPWSSDDSGNLYTGGYFTTAGGISANGVAKVEFLTTPGSFNKTSPGNDVNYQPISLTLTWETSEIASEYQYCYDTIDNNECDTSWVSAGLNTSVQLDNLNYNTTYYWQVQSTNDYGTALSNGGTWWKFTTKTGQTSLTVTDISDNGPGSLRQAIASANIGDTITFDPSLSGQTITLASSLDIDKSITIDGSDLDSPIQISGNNSVRVMSIHSEPVVLKSLIIRNGSSSLWSTTTGGGGIYIYGIYRNLRRLDHGLYIFVDNFAFKEEELLPPPALLTEISS